MRKTKTKTMKGEERREKGDEGRREEGGRRKTFRWNDQSGKSLSYSC